MFSDCSSLTCFPDISKWDYSNIMDKGYMFTRCQNDFLKENYFEDNYNINYDSSLNVKINNKDIIRSEDLKYIHQIEIIFNHVNNITEDLINDLKGEIRNLIKEGNFSIIEVKKGSLTVITFNSFF